MIKLKGVTYDLHRIAIKKSYHGTGRENTKKPLRLF